MIKKVRGNLLDADVQALVNTVNTVGVMGRGIALQFKKAFPENYKAYRKVCDEKKLTIGEVYTYDRERLDNPRYIINFPTKRHWKSDSRIEDIQSGLQALVREINRLGIESIAIPPLGCGLGGLNWKDVYRKIEETLGNLENIVILVFEPAGAPKAHEMKDRTSAPKMTAGRAALLSLMKLYLEPLMDDTITLLEIHKLMYFMQESGAQLKLDYIKGMYGPYATNLHHVLERIEGHFIMGYGDGSETPGKEIVYKGDAVRAAEHYLEIQSDYKARFLRIEKLINGFETPYGMELLSSVHWIAVHENERATDHVEEAIKSVHNWNDRKRNIFKSEHIHVAWKHLREQSWF